MASSETEIANMALAHLAQGKAISSLTERSAEAELCALFIPTTRRQTLRDFPWAFAKRKGALGLISQNTGTYDEFGYTYSFPAGSVKFRRILSGQRRDSRQTRVAFELRDTDSGTVIDTDMVNAYGEWTRDVTELERMPDDFKMAWSLRLASAVAPRLSGGDPFKMGDRAMELYMRELAKARANAANEEVPDDEPVSEFEAAR